MREIKKAEYEKIHPDFRGIWTTERDDLPDWQSIRHQYVGKRTLMSDGSLLIEGLHFQIID